MPFVTREVFLMLISEISNNLAAVPWYKDDHYEPMCAVYNRKLVKELELYISKGNFKLPDLFRNVPVKKIPVSRFANFIHDSYFFSVNTESDLHKAENIYKSINP
jgi:molybdopterin-guanine dinucleotide biosynthesis protein A